MYFSPPGKSETCFSRSGSPLSEYGSEEEAQSGADYENARNGDVQFVPYRCERCGKFHLKPEQYYVPKLGTPCSCTDFYGDRKDAYPSEAMAQKMARIRAEAGVRLTVYRCPEGNGWHLTSHGRWRAEPRTFLLKSTGALR